MKSIYKLIVSVITFTILIAFQGCESILEEPVRSQFAESNLLTSKQGIESVLVDAYAKNNNQIRTRNIVKREEMTSDLLWQTGGGENGTAVPLMQFRWDSNNTLEAFCWIEYWIVVRNANIVLGNLDNVQDFSSDQQKKQLEAEARFMRVWAYYQLWNQYGPLPLRKSLDDPLELPRATDEEFKSFIEQELKDVIPDLPSPDNVAAYGRVHDGGARALLCKWYLNTHQWQNCANMAQEIISSHDFSLYPDYNEMFALENEVNDEFILVKTKLANSGNTNVLLPTALPSVPSVFKMGLDGGINGVVNEKWANYASNYRLYDEFYYSFDPDDERKGRILTRYVDTKDNIVNLLDYDDATRAIKYPPDPEASGAAHGNDVPMIRYADILLARAEALNELDGPTQAAIDLINLVRDRAGVDDLLLADFESKEELREHILKERRWEFWYEGKRRRDLIRMGKFIEYAHDRGVSNATEDHVWFPIPQSAIDANTLLEQNKGY
jgi:starch-binding outer membrane protein, SusD/RagB family